MTAAAISLKENPWAALALPSSPFGAGGLFEKERVMATGSIPDRRANSGRRAPAGRRTRAFGYSHMLRQARQWLLGHGALIALAAWLSLMLLGLTATGADAAADSADDPWPEIRDLLFDQRAIQEDAGVIALEAPQRAEDAAIVPIRIDTPNAGASEDPIETIHLVIDANPAPIAGVFHLTPESRVQSIATRVRVNAYSEVRAIAETRSGALFMASHFVKASGGCSAPALKDHDSAMARLGQMKLKPMTPITAGMPAELQVMISHPNYSGLQIDQLDRTWIPPQFVDPISISQGEQPIMRVEGAISLSENPSIRFAFTPIREGALEVEASDTEGGRFTERLPANAGPDA
jgi:sulfur-oxidizing protein SoxY